MKAPVETVFTFWQQIEQFSDHLPSVLSVEQTGPQTSRWVVRAPFNLRVSYTARVTNVVPLQRICWEADHDILQQVQDERIRSRGQVEFHASPDGHATDVRLTLRYALNGSAASRVLQALHALDYPRQPIQEGLQQLGRAIERQVQLRRVRVA